MRNKNFHNTHDLHNLKPWSDIDQDNYTDTHRNKIAAYYGSKYFLIMAVAGVVLVASGAFAPFGATLLGAIYLASSLGLSSAVIAGWWAYSDAKNEPTYISKESKRISQHLPLGFLELL